MDGWRSGSATALQAVGRGFKSLTVHQSFHGPSGCLLDGPFCVKNRQALLFVFREMGYTSQGFSRRTYKDFEKNEGSAYRRGSRALSFFLAILPTFSRACCFRRAGFDAQAADAFARALDPFLQGVL